MGQTLLFLLTTLSSSGAAEADLRAIIAKFATVTDFSETGAVVQELTATGDPAVERPLAALADGNLYARTADSMVFVGKEGDENVQLFDPLSGEPAGEASED
ncbi:urea ABC transporter permease subunit UrtB, partial [Mesorhizobium sp. M2D.F.Ca.ET.145.01.1.1]